MQDQIRVPVLNIDGSPAMPTKASRARRWLRDGKAKVVHNDLGVFQIQLLQEASSDKQQNIVVGIDAGKLYTGIAVQSSKSTLLMLHLELPFLTVKRRIEQRKMMRRSRRARRINRKVSFKNRNHRQERFNNRKPKQLPPSIKANKLLEKRVIIELMRVFPITDFILELVKAKGSKGFSPVMVGQYQQLAWLESMLPTLTIEGWKTSILRDRLGLIKNKTNKSVQEPATHAVDGVAIASHYFIRYVEDKVNHCANWFGDVRITQSEFKVIGRPKYSRRELHSMRPSIGGIRRRYGGSSTNYIFRKGDLVDSTKGIGYISGYSNKLVSVSNHNWKLKAQITNTKVNLLQRCTGLTVNH